MTNTLGRAFGNFDPTAPSISHEAAAIRDQILTGSVARGSGDLGEVLHCKMSPGALDLYYQIPPERPATDFFVLHRPGKGDIAYQPTDRFSSRESLMAARWLGSSAAHSVYKRIMRREGLAESQIATFALLPAPPNTRDTRTVAFRWYADPTRPEGVDVAGRSVAFTHAFMVTEEVGAQLKALVLQDGLRVPDELLAASPFGRLFVEGGAARSPIKAIAIIDVPTGTFYDQYAEPIVSSVRRLVEPSSPYLPIVKPYK